MSGKKTVKRIVIGVVAGITAAAVVTGAVVFNSNTAIAKSSLPGVEAIVNDNGNNNPFIIVEVVPEAGKGSMGYLVSGQEPVDNKDTAIADMPVSGERTSKLSTETSHYKYGELKGNAFTTDEPYKYEEVSVSNNDLAKSLTIRGTYTQVTAGEGDYVKHAPGTELKEYNDTNVLADYPTLTWSEYVVDGTAENYQRISATFTLFAECHDFTEDSAGSYRITRLIKITGDEVAPVPIASSTSEFNWQYFKPTKIESSMPEEGRVVYSQTNSDSDTPLEYFGKIEKRDVGGEEVLVLVSAADSTELSLQDIQDSSAVNYYTIAAERQDGSGNYYKIDEVTAGAEFSKGDATYEEMLKYGGVYDILTVPVGWTYKYGSKQSSGFDYAPGAGDYTFTPDFTAEQVDDFAYEGGITNKEWFKQYVLDVDNDPEKLNATVIDVITVTPDKLTEELLAKTNLLYFAGKCDGVYYSTDLTNRVAAKIVKMVREDNFPVIIERSTIVDNKVWGENGLANDTVAPKINGMAACLMQKGSFPNVTNMDDIQWGLDWGVIYANLHGSYPNDVANKEYSYVNGTVYVNDDMLDDYTSICNPTGVAIDSKKVVAVDFDTKFGSKKTDGGFKPVINEIESENTYLDAAKKELLAVEATKAKAIRHILNYGDRRNTTKSQLSILDIEPYETSQYYTFNDDGTIKNTVENNWIRSTQLNSNIMLYNNTKGKVTNLVYSDIFTPRWLVDNVSTQFKDQIKTRTEAVDGTANYLDKDNNSILTVKQMGTSEFIGKTEDLNETYDLIYIGADTSLMNTRLRENDKHTLDRGETFANRNTNFLQKTPLTIYNDGSIDSLVYSHLGDSIEVSSWETEKLSGSSSFRMSGNDITEQKYNELVRYLDAGYAIVLSDYFFYTQALWWDPNTNCSTEVNKTFVDESSYMYKFLTTCMSKNGDGTYKYYGKNVFRRFELESANANYASNLSEFVNHLNIAKMQVECESKPRDYNAEGYLIDDDKDGIYWLEYTVTLKNDAAVGASGEKYTAKLFVDDDADGKYETEEELTGLEITRTGDGSSVDYDDLSTGSTYKIRRQVPEGYVGCLSWKIVFSQNNSSNVTRSIAGFSAVPAKTKPTIKVLQISSSDSSKYAWEPNREHFALDYQSADYEERALTADAGLASLMSGVNDFQIDVDRINAYTYITDHVGEYAEFLSQYDMVVMGFTDSYEFSDVAGSISNATNCRNAILAIRAYALSGRSILFTHDLTYFSYSGAAGEYVNTYLRDVQGMDRFGIYSTKLADSEGKYSSVGADKLDTIDEYKTKFDEILKSRGTTVSDSTKLGYSNSHLLRFATNNKNKFFGLTNRQATREYLLKDGYGNANYNINNSNDTSSTLPETVSMINEGQITRYPYMITSKDNPYFPATATHSQYFQLNLDTVDSYWLTKEEREKNGEIEGDDITVWYTIGNRGVDNSEDSSKASVTNLDNNYYKAVQNDVRNDYYLYSRGNVFYTGAGHSFVDNALERKLFINTLVAAYNSGIHAPTLEYKENKYSQTSGMKNNTITNMYLPYDGTINQFLDADDKITINFRTKNVNIRNNNKPLYAKFYVTVPSGTTGSFTLGKKSYKEVTVTFTAKEGVDIADGTVGSSSGSRLVDNYTTYQIKISRDALGLDSTAVHDINRGNFDFYIRLGLDELDPSSTLSILPAGESMTPLNVFCTELLDLE